VSIYGATMDTDNISLIEESSVTARGYRHRTTIPSRIYHFLKLKDKDRLRWIVLKDGTLIIQKEKPLLTDSVI